MDRAGMLEMSRCGSDHASDSLGSGRVRLPALRSCTWCRSNYLSGQINTACPWYFSGTRGSVLFRRTVSVTGHDVSQHVTQSRDHTDTSATMPCLQVQGWRNGGRVIAKLAMLCFADAARSQQVRPSHIMTSTSPLQTRICRLFHAQTASS